MWSINLIVILMSKKADINIAESVKNEITEILKKHLEANELDDYSVEIEF